MEIFLPYVHRTGIWKKWLSTLSFPNKPLLAYRALITNEETQKKKPLKVINEISFDGGKQNKNWARK